MTWIGGVKLVLEAWYGGEQQGPAIASLLFGLNSWRAALSETLAFCNRRGMGHLLGYARVSTTDQQPHLQVDALQRAGCYRVFTETASGARADRPALDHVLDQLRPGDTLVVWRLDRLGRSLGHLVDTVTGLAERGIGFRSLQESIYTTTTTTTPGGKLVFHVFAALAEFERDLVRDQDAVKADFWAIFDVGDTEPGDTAIAVANRQAAEFAAKWKTR
jgi:hypothetical protein